MPTPKTLSEKDLNRVIEWATLRTHAWHADQVSSGFVSPIKVNSGEVACALLQERRRTEELEKEVERFQKERNEAIEMAEKLERRLTDALLLNKRFEGDVRDYKEELNQAFALAKGYREALEAVDYCCCDTESVDGHHLYVCCKHQALAASPTSLLEALEKMK